MWLILQESYFLRYSFHASELVQSITIVTPFRRLTSLHWTYGTGAYIVNN